MSQPSYEILRVSKNEGAIIYGFGAYDFATGATGVGGVHRSAASSNNWNNVRFLHIASKVDNLPTSLVPASQQFVAATGTILGGSTPIGDIRGEGTGFIGVGNNTTLIGKDSIYSGALYAIYEGAGATRLTGKIGIGTTSADIATSGYYQGTFKTKDIHEFDTVFSLDTGDLTKITTGSGVYKGQGVTIQTLLRNKDGRSLRSASSVAADPFVSGQRISILNSDGDVVFNNYKTTQSPSFAFSRQQNIDVFGSHTKNFGIRSNVINKDGGSHITDFFLFGNSLSLEKVIVQASGISKLNESTGNVSINTGSITSAADRTEAVKGFSNQEINNTGVTGFIEFNLFFDQTASFTNYDNIGIYVSNTGTGFNVDQTNFLGNYQLDQIQGQPIRLSPNDFGGFQDTLNLQDDLYFKFRTKSEVSIDNQIFSIGPYRLQGVAQGDEVFLGNAGEQSLFGDLALRDTGLSGSGGAIVELTQKTNVGGGGVGTISIYDDTGNSSIKFSSDTGVDSFVSGNIGIGTTVVPADTTFSVVGIGSTKPTFTVKAGIGTTAGFVGIGSTNPQFNLDASDIPKANIAAARSKINSTGSAIMGGADHHISGDFNMIAGGVFNNISGNDFSFVGGGSGIDITGSEFSTSVGGFNNDIFLGSGHFIGGGHNNMISGVDDVSVIAGGKENKIFGGNKNFVGAGATNVITGDSNDGIIIGGTNNKINSCDASTIGGGLQNTIDNSNVAFCVGGTHTIGPNAGFSAILGGGGNVIGFNSYNSVILGGISNVNSGQYSMAGGQRALIPSGIVGATVLADGQGRDHISSGSHTATFDFANGVYVPATGYFNGLHVSGVPVSTGSSAEADTLQTVTDRGATTTNSITVGSTLDVADSIRHAGDTDTRLDFSADQVKIVSNGITRLQTENAGVIINEGGVSADFRVEGDTDTHALFVDGSADNVGIGVNTPTTKLAVDGTISGVSGQFDQGLFISGVPVSTGSAAEADTLATVTARGNTTTTNINLSGGSLFGDTETPNIKLGNAGGAEFNYGTSKLINGGSLVWQGGGVEKFRITAAGNVGIGTNSPLYRLDVGGNTSSTSNTIRMVQGNDGTAIRVGAGGLSNDVTLLRVDGGGNGSSGISDTGAFGFSLKYMGSRAGNANSLSIFSDNQALSQVEAVTILQDGKVGIGTTAATKKLEVVGDISGQSIFLDGGNSSDMAINFAASANGIYCDPVSQMRFAVDSASSAMVLSSNNIQFGAGGNSKLTWSTNNYLEFNGGGTKARLNSAGLGIGTTNPDGILNTSGGNVTLQGVNKGYVRALAERASVSDYTSVSSSILTLANYFGQNEYGQFVDNAGNFIIQKSGLATHLLKFSTTDMTVSGYGIKFAKNQTVTSLAVDLRNENGDEVGFYSPATNVIGFVTDRTERMRITSAGNVGIGTDTPTTELAVAGTISGVSGQFDQGLFISGVPVSTGSAAEADTLATVTARGNSTSTSILSTGPHISGVTGFFSNRLHVGTPIGTHDCAIEAAHGSRQLIVSDTTSVAAGVGGKVDFFGAYTIGGAKTLFGSIQAKKTNASAGHYGGGLALSTRVNGGGAATERLTILEGGNVGIGTVSPDATLQIKAGDTTGFLVQSSSDKNILWAEDTESVNVRQTLNVYHTTVASRYLQLGWGSVFANDNDNELSLGSNFSSASATRILLAAESADNIPPNTIQMQANHGLAIFSGSSSNTFEPTALIDVRGDGFISGSVGIGTTSPSGALEISAQITGASTVDYPFFITAKDDGNTINQTAGAGVGLKFRIAGNSSSDSLVGASIAAIRENGSDTDSSTALGFFTSQNDETLDEAMRITNDGKVGIGTATPSAALSVGDGGDKRASNTDFVISDDTPQIELRDTAKSAIISFNDSQGVRIFSNYSTSTSPQFTIENDGNVGIGTSTPAAKLEVKDTVRVCDTANANNFVDFSLNSTDGFVLNRFLGGSSSSNLTYNAGTLKGSKSNSTGTIGFELDGTNAKLKVKTVSSHLVDFDSQYNQLAFESSLYGVSTTNPAFIFKTFTNAGALTQEKIHIYNGDTGPVSLQPSGGNVGIGLTSPTTELAVDGTISGVSGQFSQGLFISGVPVSTGSAAEADTLATVTARGNSTSTSIISTGPHISGGTGLFEDVLAKGAFGIHGWQGDPDTHMKGYGDRIVFTAGGLTFADFSEGSQDLIHFNGNENQDIDFRVGYDGGPSIFSRGSDGKVGIANSNPQQALDVSGSGVFSEKVGIGTNNPSGKLEINTSLSSSATLDMFQSVVTSYPSNTFLKGAYIELTDDSNAGGCSVFGIDVDVSHAKNHGSNRIYGVHSVLDGTAANNQYGGYFQAPTAAGYLGDHGDSAVVLINGKRGDGGTVGDILRVEDSDVEKFTIVGGGNVHISGDVGIGTNSPDTSLHIESSDDVLIKAVSTDGGAGIAIADNGSASETANVIRVESNDIAFKTNTSEKLRITAAGNVGIGTAVPSFTSGGGVQITQPSQANLRLSDSSDSSFNLDLAMSNDDFFIINRSSGGHLKFRVNSSTEAITVLQDGKVGIGTTAPSDALSVNGHFSATSKSFLIDHPIKENKKLQYASLEGPENGVYVRGTSNSAKIELPDYWSELVHEDSITVSLTALGKKQDLFVKSKSPEFVIVGGVGGSYDYVVYGERKDIDKLETEPLKV